MRKVPGVDFSSGSIGHALSGGLGMVMAQRWTGESYTVFALLGDGEMQEGSNWEAIMAAAQFKLDNLTLIVDHNRFQQGASLSDTNGLAPIRPRLEAFGWDVSEINGNIMSEVVPALERRGARPHRSRRRRPRPGRSTGRPRG